MGFGRSIQVDPEFELTKEGAVLVLVDDPEERLFSPGTRLELAEKLGRDLKGHKAIGRPVPQEKLARLQHERQDYEEVSCRELGELVEADQVLWLQVRDFHASPELDETSAAARMTVTLKVVNARAAERSEVRLWPVDRQGRIISAELNANDVVRAKSPEGISSLLTDKVAQQVGELFYEHPLEEE